MIYILEVQNTDFISLLVNTKSNNGDFRIRIEDTDNEETKEAVKSILNGLEWLNIKADKKIIFQSENFTI